MPAGPTGDASLRNQSLPGHGLWHDKRERVCPPTPILGPSLFPRSGILGYQGNEPLWFNLALVIKCYGGTSTGVGKKKKKKKILPCFQTCSWH